LPSVVDPEYLRSVELFQNLPDEDLGELAGKTELRDLRRGDVLFGEGDEPTELFVVVDGRIAMVNRSIDGRESVVALMERGDLFGEMPLFDHQSRSTDARALDSSRVLAIPYAPLRQLYETHPDQLWQVVRLLASRLRVMDGVLADSVFLDVTGRTAKRLLELAGDADEFSLPVTQEELAGMVGASRERVNKAIASFVRLGWLEQRERRYRILKRDQLELRAR
jgi:CRP/FNR family transcriptional regulator, cyclic AMP receptor protein